ncbi:hypothetical protein N7517_001538 [Penicillium concentricum]|uniref:Uncharacterized protein n=1 Tax=Penicillium concentricum TaxID=293559 RepID=A0A9W9SS75_9EURO|nr:uncharacterized protein N7517_001538 [Penicillium concentricum]KAJ5383627.1 hypothetical protein N7517_001538 [Penicillium concentricum]
MDGLIFFVVFPMVDIPLISWAAAWIKLLLARLHVWMIRRTFNALKRDIETWETKMFVWANEFRELKKQLNMEMAASPAWENRLHAIQRDRPTPVQAMFVHDETERLKARTRWFRHKLILLLKERKSLLAMRMNHLERLGILEQSINLFRLANSTVYRGVLLVTDDHA